SVSATLLARFFGRPSLLCSPARSPRRGLSRRTSASRATRVGLARHRAFPARSRRCLCRSCFLAGPRLHQLFGRGEFFFQLSPPLLKHFAEALRVQVDSRQPESIAQIVA